MDTLPSQAGLYVHFPFCRTRCHYCDFNTYAVPSIPREAYTEAIVDELRRRASELGARPLVSIFFGGGTPGLWGAEGTRTVLDEVRRQFDLAPDCEITIEVNPGECSEEVLRAYREVAGFNRVSFGIQSLTDPLLKAMDRLHSAEEALEACRAVGAAGYDNWTGDLIFGLPGQSPDVWLRDLHRLLDYEPRHISVYNLMVEPGTPLFVWVKNGKVKLPSDEIQVEMMTEGWKALAERGYAQYEISNFCLPGRESVHNTLYWTGRPYLGLGAGAHSFLPTDDPGVVGRRTSNVRKFTEYMAKLKSSAAPEQPTIAFRETVDSETHLRERIMTGLRLRGGLDVADCEAVTGLDANDVYASIVGPLEAQGLLERSPGRWRLPHEAQLVSDAVFERFFDE